MEESNPENPQPQMLPKLKVFKTIRNNFAIFGIGPELVTQSYPFNRNIFMAFLILSSGVILIGVDAFNHAETFSEYTQSIYTVSGGVLVILALMIIVLQVKKLFEFINRCDSILNSMIKYSATRSIAYEANQFEEKLSQIVFFIMTRMTLICVMVPWTIYIYFLYFSTDLGADAFKLPVPMWQAFSKHQNLIRSQILKSISPPIRFPFDWKNPFGFLIAITMQYAMASYGLTMVACLFAQGIGSYLYGIALSKNIKGSLFAINGNTQAKTDPSILLKQINEFVEFHSSAKQVISNFSDIFQHFFTLLFMWSLITICGALLLIQIQLLHHSDNLVELLLTLLEVIYAFGLLFVACELGQRISLAFEECSDMVDQFEWYLFPDGIQRMLPLILNFTQQPFDIKCFGSKASDRETFKVVVNTAFSYFTVLHRIF